MPEKRLAMFRGNAHASARALALLACLSSCRGEFVDRRWRPYLPKTSYLSAPTPEPEFPEASNWDRTAVAAGDLAISISRIWTSFDNAAGFDPTEPYTPLWHFKGATYYVWVDKALRPWVAKLSKDGETIVALDSQPDYLVQADGHHRFSMGIDKDGYIHITGDMHNYMDETTGVITPYPRRYQKQTILYWKSRQPEDLSGGFVFAGGKGAATAIPGGGWLTGRFFSGPKGELFYSSQVHAYESASNRAQMALGLYAYDTTTGMWEARGGVADHQEDNMTRVKTVLFWEEAGGGERPWFQNYQGIFNFDKDGRLHFSVPMISGPAFRVDRVVYASSPDQGKTWFKANGQAIPKLPIRGADGQASQGDIPFRAESDGGLSVGVSALADATGVVGVGARDETYPFAKWRTWNGQSWQASPAKDFGKFASFATSHFARGDNLVFGVNNQLIISPAFDAKSVGLSFTNLGSLAGVSAYALRHYGEIYAAAVDPLFGGISIVRARIDASPLPTGWQHQDIDPEGLPYLGTAGLRGSDQVLMTTHGIGVGGTHDSLHFAYRPVQGDGEICARVVLPDAELEGNVYAGLMLRTSLEPEAIQASVLVGTKAGLFTFRKASGADSGREAHASAAPSWLRLVRSGKTISASTSSDGSTWQAVGSFTADLPETLYWGLAATAGTHRYYMRQARFEGVVAP